MKFAEDPIVDLAFALTMWEWEHPAKVVVIAEHREWGRWIRQALLDRFGPNVESVSKSSGREQMTLHDGATIRLVSPKSVIGVRGMTVDIVWLACVPSSDVVDEARLILHYSQAQTVPADERIWW